jgi:hypothetical protein
MPQAKTAVTVRLQPDLLAQVRESAARDNRSLTNFIETALRERIGAARPAPRRGARAATDDSGREKVR